MATVEDLRSLERLIRKLPPDKLAELQNKPAIRDRLDAKWLPNPGQQEIAFASPADELFYGGTAGGGKTDLLLGIAMTVAHRSLVLRRTNKEASRFIRRFGEMVGHRDGWNGQLQTFQFPDDKLVEFGGCQLEDDKQKYKGEPKDFIGFDEISDFSESQYRFIIGWNRSAKKGQRCRVICAGNPPTTAEGLWVVQYWGPWLDETHPNPARPGELRWFTTIGGKDTEVDGPGPHMVDGEPIMARSRTFIPAKLEDNPDLAETNYNSVLAALPDGLREAYKEGRFTALLRDDDWQVIPTAWILAAQDRWTPDGYKAFEMTAMGLDCAGGGKDEAALSARHGGWFAPIETMEGEKTADGAEVAGMVIRHRRHGCPVVVDVGGGYAGATIERFKDNRITYQKFDGGGGSIAKAKDTGVGFKNKRAEALWRFREALDPNQEGGSAVALPPDPVLRADLAAPRYEIRSGQIIIEPKEKIKERIGRSPNRGDAACMCLSEGDRAVARQINQRQHSKPKVILGYAGAKRRR